MEKITIETTINAPITKVWEYWNEPEHIKHWGFAGPDSEVPAAQNDLREGGELKVTMAAKDKSWSFDFGGKYTQVKENQLIEFVMDDGREVKTEFNETAEGVKITQSFDPENENPIDFQKQGWQSILDNFKKHVETD